MLPCLLAMLGSAWVNPRLTSDTAAPAVNTVLQQHLPCGPVLAKLTICLMLHWVSATYMVCLSQPALQWVAAGACMSCWDPEGKGSLAGALTNFVHCTGREGRGGFGAASSLRKKKTGGLSNKEKAKQKNMPAAARMQQLSRRRKSKAGGAKNFKGRINPLKK